MTLEQAHSGFEATIAMPNGKRIALKMPAGIDKHHTIAVQMGNETFHVAAQIQPHRWFERQGNDLRITVEVPIMNCLTGSNTSVQSIDQIVGMKIPSLTQDGDQIRIPGQGMNDFQKPDHRGDLLVTIRHQK